MKKLRRLALLVACAALAGSVSAGAVWNNTIVISACAGGIGRTAEQVYMQVNGADNTQVNGAAQGNVQVNGAAQASAQHVSEVVALVNAERAKAGLPALTIDAKAQLAAQCRADELQRSFSHTRPDGTSGFTALDAVSASYRAAGENIGMGHRTPQQVVAAWMDSPTHRANILSSKYTAIGVGYTAGNMPSWSQMFIG